MEDLGKYTRRTELYKLSAEEQTEKMKLVMKEVEKISAYTGVSEEAAYNLFLNGYDVPSELDGQKIAFSESELTPDLLSNLAENNVRSVKVMSDESIAAGYGLPDFLDLNIDCNTLPIFFSILLLCQIYSNR